jgi:hypothetical protein
MAAMPEWLRSAIVFVGGCAVLGATAALLAPGRPIVMSMLFPLWGGVVAWDRLHRDFKLRVTRVARGQCVQCGYDLTGNVSGVCPECGRVR